LYKIVVFVQHVFGKKMALTKKISHRDVLQTPHRAPNSPRIKRCKRLKSHSEQRNCCSIVQPAARLFAAAHATKNRALQRRQTIQIDRATVRTARRGDGPSVAPPTGQNRGPRGLLDRPLEMDRIEAVPRVRHWNCRDFSLRRQFHEPIIQVRRRAFHLRQT
jgi:hypothetical protein